VLTLNAQDCVEGKVLAEEQAQAPSKESVLTVMGTAVSAFREKLGESLASIQRYDAKIEEATTPSLEALKAYSQGLRARRSSGDFDSVPFFRRAIDLDPEFALAYARLGTVYANLGQADESRKMTTRAYELRDKVSEVERFYVVARYYTTAEPDVEKALDSYKVWLATFPNDYTALTNSALLHKQQGNLTEAIRKLELATRVAPDQPLGWTNLGQSYFDAGKYADARRVIETAIKLQDSTGARVGLYQVAVMIGDSALADEQVAAVRGRRDEVDMFAIRMFAATFRGRLREASELAVDFQARALALSRGPQAGNVMMQIAISEALFGLRDQANARVIRAEKDGILGDDTIDDRMVVAAILKDGATARALLSKALAEQRTSAGAAPEGTSDGERAVKALVELAENKPAEAIALLEPFSFDVSHADVVNIWTIAKMMVGDLPAAVKGLTLLADQARGGVNSTTPYAYAMLARVQSQLGQTEEARKNYQKLFEIWKDADPDLPLLLQARADYDTLGS
jgi:tetratricopeptide (TPR) repeat protein